MISSDLLDILRPVLLFGPYLRSFLKVASRPQQKNDFSIYFYDMLFYHLNDKSCWFVYFYCYLVFYIVPKKGYKASVAVTPALFRVPSQRSLAPRVTSVTSVASDKGDYETSFLMIIIYLFNKL